MTNKSKVKQKYPNAVAEKRYSDFSMPINTVIIDRDSNKVLGTGNFIFTFTAWQDAWNNIVNKKI